MSDEDEVSWQEQFKAYFGKGLSKEQLAAFDRAIDKKVRNLVPGEILAAVDSLQDRRARLDTTPQYAPTASDLIDEIFRNKALKSRGVGSFQGRNDAIEGAKAELDRCPDDQAIYELMCKVSAQFLPEDFAVVRTYLCVSRPDYRSPTLPDWLACRTLADKNGIELLEAHRILWDAMWTSAGVAQIQTPMPSPDLARAKDEDTPVSCALDGLAAKTARAFKARMGAQQVQSRPVYRAQDPEPEDSVTEFVDF